MKRPSKIVSKPKRSVSKPKATRLTQRSVAAPSPTSGECPVLSVFRKYLMSPGQMLCFASSDLPLLRDTLERLTSDGLVVAEKFPGGYSLTPAGFARMRACG